MGLRALERRCFQFTLQQLDLLRKQLCAFSSHTELMRIYTAKVACTREAQGATANFTT